MRDETVGRFASHCGHQRAEAADENRRRAKGIRAGIDGRDHQRVLVELAPVVQPVAGLPALPDRTHGQNIVAQPTHRRVPGRAEAPLDVGLDLSTQAEDEAAS